MPRCAEYAKRLGLADEPAFSYWVKFALKKRERLLKKVLRRKRSNRFKYGIAVPRTVKEAYALDKQNGNNFWAKAIEKEMGSVMVAFKPLGRGTAPPDDYKEIPFRMIFHVKMDFTRNARLVASGHLMDPPEALTYSSVVSRDRVWLVFMLAKLNGLDMIMTDTGNAYLNLGYRCKDVGKPTRYLGAEIAESEIKGADGTVQKLAIHTVEDQQGNSFGKCRGVKTHVESGYRPELDKTDELDDDKANSYQSLIRILQWVSCLRSALWRSSTVTQGPTTCAIL